MKMGVLGRPEALARVDFQKNPILLSWQTERWCPGVMVRVSTSRDRGAERPRPAAPRRERAITPLWDTNKSLCFWDLEFETQDALPSHALIAKVPSP